MINVKILPYARIVEKPLYTRSRLIGSCVYLECFSWSLIVDRLVTLIVVLRTLNMWELYIAVDCWIAWNRVVTSKNTVLLICLNQRSGVKRIPQQVIFILFIFPATVFSWCSGHRSLSVISLKLRWTKDNSIDLAVFRNFKKNSLKSMKVFSTNWERKFTNQITLCYLGLVTSDDLRSSDHDVTSKWKCSAFNWYYRLNIGLADIASEFL